MNLGRILEALGAAIHQEDDAPPRRGGGRAQSPIPPAGSVNRWQPPQGPAPTRRRPLRAHASAHPRRPASD